jgi:hypothetical protein
MGHLTIGGLRILASRPRGRALEAYQHRLQQFAGVWELQKATDHNHEAALFQKALYQAIGLLIIVIPSGAIMAGAFDVNGHSHSTSLALFAEFASISLVAAAVLLFRKPTSAWACSRMRAEALRLHTHICLANLPPYDEDDPAVVAERVIRDVESANTETLRALIETLVNSLHAIATNVVLRPVDQARADAYETERIQEQLQYFERTIGVVGRLLSLSGAIFRGTLLLALAAALLRWMIADQPSGLGLSDALGTIVRVCVGLVTLILAARAVVGWESRLAVYAPMRENLESWRETLEGLKAGSWGAATDAEWQRRFRALSIAIECEMSREALQWLTAVERELYEVPI